MTPDGVYDVCRDRLDRELEHFVKNGGTFTSTLVCAIEDFIDSKIELALMRQEKR